MNKIKLHRFSIFTICVVALLLGGCKLQKQIDDLKSESKQWRDLADTRLKALNVQLDKAIVAIPGERYLRLIDAVHSGNEQEKKTAQAFIQSLFGVKVDQPLEVSVWIQSDLNKRINAGLFFGEVPHGTIVKAYLDAYRDNLQPAGIVPKIPQNADEIRKQLISDLNSAIDDLVGTASVGSQEKTGTGPDIQKHTTIEVSSRGLPDPIRFTTPESGDPLVKAKQYVASQSALKAQAVDKVAASIMKLYQEKSLPLEGTRLSKPYSLLSGSPLVFVLIQADDFEAHKNSNLKVRILGHEAGKVDAPLKMQPPKNLTAANFWAHEMVTGGRPTVKVRWAVFNIEDQNWINKQTLDLVTEVDKFLDEWEVLQSKKSPNPKTK